jgi:hypothetical protein
MFAGAFSRGHQLLRGDPRAALHLACGLMLRGDVVVSDVTRNVDRLRKDLRMVAWNEYGARTSSLYSAIFKSTSLTSVSTQGLKREFAPRPRCTKSTLFSRSATTLASRARSPQHTAGLCTCTVFAHMCTTTLTSWTRACSGRRSETSQTLFLNTTSVSHGVIRRVVR